MIYMLDTANIEAIRKTLEFYPVDGVTTNPTIIAKENTDYKQLLKDIRKLVGNDRMLHVQTTSPYAEGMVQEALALKEFVGGCFYAKIPASEQGIKAMQILKEKGIHITATAIFTQQQALISAKAGADFVAPYVNRLDNISSDGVGVVTDIVSLFKTYNFETKVLAASFKNAEQVHRISLGGAHSVTISPELFESLLYHPLTNQSIADFTKDWEGVYGEGKSVLDLLK